MTFQDQRRFRDFLRRRMSAVGGKATGQTSKESRCWYGIRPKTGREKTTDITDKSHYERKP